MWVDNTPTNYIKNGQNYSGFDNAVKKLGLGEKESKDASYLINRYLANGGQDWNKVREEVAGYNDTFRQPLLDLIEKLSREFQ